MAKMPTRDNLSNRLPQPSQQIVPGVQPVVARAVQGVGGDLARTAAMTAGLADKEKAKTDAVDLARARAIWAEGLTKEDGSYTLDQRPNYNDWDKEVGKSISQIQGNALGVIRDPHLKEKFQLETRVDAARHQEKISARARAIGNEARKTNLDIALDNLTDIASVKEDDEEAGGILRDIGETLRQAVETGALTPAEAAKKHQFIERKFAVARATKDATERPERAYYHLTGKGSLDLYLKKLRRRESGGSDTAKNSESSATGRYQFTTGTWAGLMKQYPELGLTKEGRLSAVQQEKAIRVYTATSEKILSRNSLPITEGTRYVMHFMGHGAGPKLLKADGSKDASKMFPEAAAANKTIFYNRKGQARTVAGVIKVLTRGFGGDYGGAPGHYDALPASTRMQLAEAASGAAAKLFGEAEKEEALLQAQRDADAAMAMPVEDGWEFLKTLPGTRRDEASKLFTTELKRKKEAERQQKADEFKEVHTKVIDAIKRRDFVAARQAIPDGMDQEGKSALEKMIAEGTDVPDEITRQQTQRKYDAMRLTDPDAFAALTPTDWAEELQKGGLTIEDIERYQGIQQKASKGADFKRARAQTLSSQINEKLESVGVATKKSAAGHHKRKADLVRSMVQIRIDQAEQDKGKALTPKEERDIVDDVFMETSRPWLFGLSSRTYEIDDVMGRFEKAQSDNPAYTMENAAARLKALGKPVNARNLLRLLEGAGY